MPDVNKVSGVFAYFGMMFDRTLGLVFCKRVWSIHLPEYVAVHLFQLPEESEMERVCGVCGVPTKMRWPSSGVSFSTHCVFTRSDVGFH